MHMHKQKQRYEKNVLHCVQGTNQLLLKTSFKKLGSNIIGVKWLIHDAMVLMFLPYLIQCSPIITQVLSKAILRNSQ